MCDTSDVPYDILRSTSEHDDPPHSTTRPTTPLPDSSRTLRRTVSYASIDTIRPSSSKGVRRRINEISENLKHKSTKNRREHSSTQDIPNSVAHGPASDSKVPPAIKAKKRGRKATVPLRDSSRGSEEENILAIAHRLNSGVPFEWSSPLTFLSCESESLLDKPLPKEDEPLREGCSFPARSLGLGAGVVAERQDTFQSPQIPKAGIEDVQLDIQPSESDVTIWDGLRAAHHLFRCRLYLRCTTHPYDGVSLPDIPRIEMSCNTHPIRSQYTRRPVLRTAYTGASPSLIANSSGLPNVNPVAGIHIDRFWRTVLDDDGTWGWYRDAFVPLSPRLFDKMDYREFKLVSQVWVGESCVEDELMFGISMLLREVDMK